MACADAHMRKNASQHLLIELALVDWRCGLLVADELDKARREFSYRQDEIRYSGGNGAARHRGILGLVRLLHENDAARLLDGTHANGAIRAGPCQDHRKSIAMLFG